MMGSGGDGGGGGETSVIERQRARMKWRQQHFQPPQLPPQPEPQQQQILNYFGGESDQIIDRSMLFPQFQGLMDYDDDQNLIEILTLSIKQDPCMEDGWIERSSDFGMNYAFSSCSPTAAAAAAGATSADKKEAFPAEKLGRESYKRRKTDKTQSLKVCSAYL